MSAEETTATRIGAAIGKSINIAVKLFWLGCILIGTTGFLIVYANLPWLLLPWLQRVLGE